MMTFYGLMELIYIRPRKDSIFIYSSSEHFLEGEDNKEMRDVLYNWMKHFGLKLVKAHASGHANMDDIKRLVKEIKADMVIPVHTQNQGIFRDFHSNVKMPVWGKKIGI
jgi:mRNA degradation ribonuclease J1/J2